MKKKIVLVLMALTCMMASCGGNNETEGTVNTSVAKESITIESTGDAGKDLITEVMDSFYYLGVSYANPKGVYAGSCKYGRSMATGLTEQDWIYAFVCSPSYSGKELNVDSYDSFISDSLQYIKLTMNDVEAGRYDNEELTITVDKKEVMNPVDIEFCKVTGKITNAKGDIDVPFVACYILNGKESQYLFGYPNGDGVKYDDFVSYMDLVVNNIKKEQ